MTNSSMKLTYILCLTVFISACGVHISNVRQTPISKVVVLKNNYEYTRDRNTPFCDETFTYRALAGAYYSEFEDDNGVYYRGKNGAIQFEAIKISCMDKLPDIALLRWAGIYVPNNKSLPAKMYSYNGNKPPGYKSVLPDDEKSKADEESDTHISSDAVHSPAPLKAGVADGAVTNAVVSGILAIELDSIQFLRFQAEDNSLRAAINITERPTE